MISMGLKPWNPEDAEKGKVILEAMVEADEGGNWTERGWRWLANLRIGDGITVLS